MAQAKSNSRPLQAVSFGDRPAGISATIAALLALGFVIYLLRWVILPFILSGVAAYICWTPIAWLSNRTGLPRALFAVIAFLVLMILSGTIAFEAVPRLLRTTFEIATDFRPTIDRLFETIIGDRPLELLGLSVNAHQLGDQVVKAMQDWASQMAQMLTIATWSATSLFGILLTIVLLFYFLLSGPSLARSALWLIPPRRRALVEHVWSRLDPLLKRYFGGVLCVVVYASLAAYVGLGLVLGIHHAVLLALFTGILEMIPMVGPATAIIIAGLIAVHYSEGIWPIIGFAVYVGVLRLSIDQLVGPLVLGQAARLHPVLIIFCFLSGGTIFGIAGVIMSVPVALAVRTILEILYMDSPELNASNSTSSHSDLSEAADG